MSQKLILPTTSLPINQNSKLKCYQNRAPLSLNSGFEPFTFD